MCLTTYSRFSSAQFIGHTETRTGSSSGLGKEDTTVSVGRGW